MIVTKSDKKCHCSVEIQGEELELLAIVKTLAKEFNKDEKRVLDILVKELRDKEVNEFNSIRL